MFDKLSFISDKYNALTEKVSDPQIIADQSKWQKYAKELSELEPIVKKFQEYQQVKKSIAESKELLNESSSDEELRELAKLELSEMEDKVEITKEEVLFSKGNSEVLKTLIVGKIIAKKMEESNFEENNKDDLEIIKDNVYINYYLDLEVRKNVKVTQEEIAEIYENEKAKLGNITPNSAYQQIANALVNNRAIEERNKLIDKISEEYKIEEIAKEYTEAK